MKSGTRPPGVNGTQSSLSDLLLFEHDVAIGKAAAHLERLGIVHEATGRSRNRLYVYTEYLRVLQAEPEVA